MIRADFVCLCGFVFTENLQENEASKEEDLERFYVRCPRCGEEASLQSWERTAEGDWRRKFG
jgi:phage terminase large subunit GpA-like protein